MQEMTYQMGNGQCKMSLYEGLDLTLLDTFSPPFELQSMPGDGYFIGWGLHYLDLLTRFCDLKPTDTVLDIGCSIGRIALPLTQYLTEGKYVGFDVVPEGIDWCQKNITPIFPNFQFQHFNYYNGPYNPNGETPVTFTYDDAAFDVAFAVSVFTHMPEEESDKYLEEIVRVLKPSGKALLTFFLLNDQTRANIGASKADRSFTGSDPYGYDQQKLLDKLTALGVHNIDIFPGAWWGTSQYVSYQDVIVITK